METGGSADETSLALALAEAEAVAEAVAETLLAFPTEDGVTLAEAFTVLEAPLVGVADATAEVTFAEVAGGGF